MKWQTCQTQNLVGRKLRKRFKSLRRQDMKSFADIIAGARTLGTRRFVVAQAADPVVLEAVEAARREGFCAPVLVGVRAEIDAAAREAGVQLDGHRIVEVAAKADAAAAAVRLVASGEGDVLVKGLLQTSELLKPVLDKATGLGRGRLISHVGVFLVPGFDRFVLVTDAALCIAPDLAQKADIVRNAFETAHGLGIADPVAAILCAIENVNPKMPATMDAAELVKMAESGEIAGGRVVGPLALDGAVDPAAARHKGIANPLAGPGRHPRGTRHRGGQRPLQVAHLLRPGGGRGHHRGSPRADRGHLALRQRGGQAALDGAGRALLRRYATELPEQHHRVVPAEAERVRDGGPDAARARPCSARSPGRRPGRGSRGCASAGRTGRGSP